MTGEGYGKDGVKFHQAKQLPNRVGTVHFILRNFGFVEALFGSKEKIQQKT